MRFTETALEGVLLVEPDKRADERGFFARVWCQEVFDVRGLNPAVAQTNVGFSSRRGTLRGLHFQRAPHEEAKLVRCTRGTVYDVVVDLRPESATHLHWAGFELTDESHAAVYVPEGCAHGYLTLTDGAEITYQASRPYVPVAATGLRYDDPALGIRWLIEPQVISEQDRSWPLLGLEAVA